MIEVALFHLLQHSASAWWAALQGKIVDDAKGEVSSGLFKWFHAWRQKRAEIKHLPSAMEQAVRKGVEQFGPIEERNIYLSVLYVLCESVSNDMRNEALALFTNDAPDFKMLTARYNLRQRIKQYALQRLGTATDLEDATPYLRAFFSALEDVLYKDDVFKSKLTEASQYRASRITRQELPLIKTAVEGTRAAAEGTNIYLQELIRQVIKLQDPNVQDYTEEQRKQDVQSYLSYVETTYRDISLPNPKVSNPRRLENNDMELQAIFVAQNMQCEDQDSQGESCSSALELLKSFHHVVMVGGPGTGKTTTLRYLAWRHASIFNAATPERDEHSVLPFKPIPLFIRLRKFVEDYRKHLAHNFFSYIVHEALTKSGVQLQERMFTTLRASNACFLLLLDGLDEVAEDDQHELIEGIEEYARNHSTDYILITTRPAGYEGASRITGRSFSHATIQEFTNEQIERFLRSYYSSISPTGTLAHEDEQKITDLYNSLTDNQRMNDLARNPLLLTIITRLSRDQSFPDRRVRVYEECTRWLLGEWADKRGTLPRLRLMKMRPLDQRNCVARLAYLLHERMYEQGKRTHQLALTSDEVALDYMREKIEDFLREQNRFSEAEVVDETDYFLTLMQTETGLIVRRDVSGKEVYGFVHNTFREYFAALDIARRIRLQKEDTFHTVFVPYLYNPHWQEVLMLLMDLDEVEDEHVTMLLRSILTAGHECRFGRYEDVVQQGLFFACECLNEDIVVENALVDDIVQAMAYLVLDTHYSTRSAQAIQSLNRLLNTHQYGDKAQEMLLSLLKEVTNTDDAIRIEIADALYTGSRRTTEASEKALETLLHIIEYASDLADAQHAAYMYHEYFLPGSHERRDNIQQCITRAQAPSFSYKQAIEELLQPFLRYSSTTIQEAQPIIAELLDRAQHATTIDEACCVIGALSNALVHPHLKEYVLPDWEKAAECLLALMRKPGTPFDDVVFAAHTLYKEHVQSAKRDEAVVLLLRYIPLNLSIERIISVASALVWEEYDTPAENERQIVLALLEQICAGPQFERLRFEQKVELVTLLYENSPSKVTQERATKLFNDLLNHPSQWYIKDVQVLYDTSRFKDSQWKTVARDATRLYLLLRSTEPRTKRQIQVANLIANSRFTQAETGEFFTSEEVQNVSQSLINILQETHPEPREALDMATALYRMSTPASNERQQAYDYLLTIAADANAAPETRYEAASIPLCVRDADFVDRAQAMAEIKTLLQNGIQEEQEIKQKLLHSWQSIDYTLVAKQADIPAIYALAKDDLLSDFARDEMYDILREMVPLFDTTI